MKPLRLIIAACSLLLLLAACGQADKDEANWNRKKLAAEKAEARRQQSIVHKAAFDHLERIVVAATLCDKIENPDFIELHKGTIGFDEELRERTATLSPRVPAFFGIVSYTCVDADRARKNTQYAAVIRGYDMEFERWRCPEAFLITNYGPDGNTVTGYNEHDSRIANILAVCDFRSDETRDPTPVAESTPAPAEPPPVTAVTEAVGDATVIDPPPNAELDALVIELTKKFGNAQVEIPVLEEHLASLGWKRTAYHGGGARFCAYDFAKGTDKLGVSVYCAGDSVEEVFRLP